MNNARIVVLAIAVGVGGAFVWLSGGPDTASGVTGLIAQAGQTDARSLTIPAIAYGHLADASRASTSRHGTLMAATMRN